MNVLVTGGTGFLGVALVDSLCQSSEIDRVFVLTRANEIDNARELFQSLEKVELIHGDVTKKNVIFDQKGLEKVRDKVDSVIHASGHHNLEGDYQTCFKVNVIGTQNILNLTQELPNCKYFHYFSTFAVSGTYEGIFKEDELDVGQEHLNHFSKSKFDAEFMVRSFESSHLKKRIYRLGALVGARQDGMTASIQGPYSFWNVLSKLVNKKTLINSIKYLPMPYEKSSHVPLVHIDEAVSILTKAIVLPNKKKQCICYHILSDSIPTMGEFLQQSFDEFDFKVSIVPLPKTRVNNMIMDKIGLSKELLGFLYSKCQYQTENLKKDFGRYIYSYPVFKEKLFGELRNMRQ
ncbi:MAG: SDR family oxidoreductase [Bacteriovoracaceae bacterium]